MSRTAAAGLALVVVLGVAGCDDAADTEIDAPTIDVPETIGPDTGEGDEGEEGEGGAEGDEGDEGDEGGDGGAGAEGDEGDEGAEGAGLGGGAAD